MLSFGGSFYRLLCAFFFLCLSSRYARVFRQVTKKKWVAYIMLLFPLRLLCLIATNANAGTPERLRPLHATVPQDRTDKINIRFFGQHWSNNRPLDVLVRVCVAYCVLFFTHSAAYYFIPLLSHRFLPVRCTFFSTIHLRVFSASISHVLCLIFTLTFGFLAFSGCCSFFLMLSILSFIYFSIFRKN